MTAPDQLLAEVEAVAREVAGAGRSPAHAGRDTRLADGFWLDSADLFTLVLACEVRFAIAFDADDDFSPRTLATLGTLADRIHAKRLERGSA